LLVPSSLVAGALLINLGNSSQISAADDPLYFVTVIITLELFRRRNAGLAEAKAELQLAYRASLVLLVPIFCGTILCRDLLSCAYTVAWNVKRRPTFEASRRLGSASLSDFYVPERTEHVTAYWLARDHPPRINDGIGLLERYVKTDDRVTTVAIANPFSFALGLKPARDGLLWWDLNMSFDLLHHPTAEEFLGDATVVMVPRLADRSGGCCFDTVEAQLALYGDYLQTHFQELASTDVWVLYRR
jgi:hypothetical protein